MSKPSIVLATRTDAEPRQLAAFLRHHMQWCDEGRVVIGCRPGDDISRVTALLDGEWGGRVRWLRHDQHVFSNESTMRTLGAFLAGGRPFDLVLYLDKDEFIPRGDLVESASSAIASGAADCAEGWMADRLGPGLAAYPDDLPTHADFHAAAPVRAEIIKAQRLPTRKIWLQRWPVVGLHPSPDDGRRAPGLADIDHFCWTTSRFMLSKEKIVMHLLRGDDTDYLRRLVRFEKAVEEREGSVLDSVIRTFMPLSAGIGKGTGTEGWFDYQDVYRDIVRGLPEGGRMVELGVWLGRSLAYAAEFAAVLGKRVEFHGVDRFDPAHPAAPHPLAMGGREMFDTVSASLARCCPWNAPKLAWADSAEAASLFGDGSVDALWLDADHTRGGVARELKAWLPKLAPGAVLAGHDINTHPGVALGLGDAGVRWDSWGPRSWRALAWPGNGA